MSLIYNDNTRNKINSFYNKIYSLWDSKQNQSYLGLIIVFSFLISILVIHLNIIGLLPGFLSYYVSTNHFVAIEVSFIILLFFEVLSLIFVLPKSFSRSLLKQFEILSLILLRDSFKEFKYISEPINWQNTTENIYQMLSHAFGALVIFGFILLIKRKQKHRDYTYTKVNKERFITIKRLVSITLLFIFTYLIIDDLYLYVKGLDAFKFFETFYTILIFADILIVLLSLRYSYSYPVLFRNSGFAFATVLIRLALTAPVYVNSIIGIIAVVFTLILTIIYSNYSLKDNEEITY